MQEQPPAVSGRRLRLLTNPPKLLSNPVRTPVIVFFALGGEEGAKWGGEGVLFFSSTLFRAGVYFVVTDQAMVEDMQFSSRDLPLP